MGAFGVMAIVRSVLQILRASIRTRATLQLEVLALRHQLQVLERARSRRVPLTRADRLLWVWLSRIWQGWRAANVIVKPETVLAWHRRGFHRSWRWKSRKRLGRPGVPPNVRALIRTMSEANPLWGAPRLHGELLTLGIDVNQATVAMYLAQWRRPPSQTWRTLLANNVEQLTAADFFVVPTATYRLLFVLVILAHQRRLVVHVAVTAHPNAAWTAQQLPSLSEQQVAAGRTAAQVVGSIARRTSGVTADANVHHLRTCAAELMGGLGGHPR